MKKRIVLLTLLVGLLSIFSARADQFRPGPPVFFPNTGDAEFDQFLVRLNTAALAKPEAYIADLSTAYQVPVKRIRRLLDEYRMAPVDVLLTLQLAKIDGHPRPKILERYRRIRPEGWQAIFIAFEIHPRSRIFLLLRNEIPRVIIRYAEPSPKGSKNKKGSKKKKGSGKKGSKRK